ncbi:alpha/beta fold hydrolase [Actinomadura madurae]|uniref:alpha/beta fold hydrolase n=1 Tax=Actinomadura madurae TaxID=1993 RepID=UPI0020D1FFE3|nr:alpha/beta fold hydrolase [Actinomadura madurae]MCP9947586.1 hypothetical protein [Actinomadura madurae]MCP9964349.1 hypothetical protein [Actinomadura madurae]MCP9976834.1 hypothetical protein [Actinomadura madurae]
MTSDNATPGKAATFVLVPGYWLGAWAWDAVAAELRAAGHDVHAVTPAGQAERAEESAPGADVETQIADLVRLIEDADIREVVLVAHSGANMAVTGAADRIPERIANVVYVDSGPMPSGMAGIDFHDAEARAELEKAVAEQGGGWRIPVPPFDAAADPVNLAGLTEEHLAAMRGRGTPQPFGTATQALTRPDPLPGDAAHAHRHHDPARRGQADGRQRPPRLLADDRARLDLPGAADRALADAVGAARARRAAGRRRHRRLLKHSLLHSRTGVSCYPPM